MRWGAIGIASIGLAALSHDAARALTPAEFFAFQSMCAETSSLPEAKKQQCYAYKKSKEACEVLLTYQMFGLTTARPYQSHPECIDAEYRKHLSKVKERKYEEAQAYARERAKEETYVATLRTIQGSYAFQYSTSGQMYLGSVHLNPSDRECREQRSLIRCNNAGKANVKSNNGAVSASLSATIITGGSHTRLTLFGHDVQARGQKMKRPNYDCSFWRIDDITCKVEVGYNDIISFKLIKSPN